MKNEDAKTYTRNDIQDGKRIGFIVQDIQANSNDNWSKLIGIRKQFTTTTNDEGEEIEETETLTMDYARLVCVLWQTNKDMLKRIEDLETELNSQ